MQESDARAVGSRSRRGVDQANAEALQALQGRVEVAHAPGDVVEPASAPLEKPRDGRVGSGGLDELAQPGRVPGEGGGVGALDELEDRGVGDEAALDHLTEPGDELRARQRLQEREVAQDGGDPASRAASVVWDRWSRRA